MRILFIINPAAGKGKSVKDEKGIHRFFSNRNQEYHVAHTTGEGSAYELAKKAAAEGYDTVVACGGDGTINEAVRGIAGTNTALAILPRGSGNGLARHHHIPFEVDKALEVIERNNRIAHDAVLINDRLAVNVSGIGFDAHIAHLFGKDGTRGFYGYLKLVVTEFFNFKERPYTITAGNGDTTPVTYPVFLFAIANGSQFGNEAVFAPGADTGDGKVDLALVKAIPFWKVPLFALRVFTRRVEGSPHITLLKGESFLITCNEEAPLHLDGETGGFSKSFRIQTIKNAFSLIVP